MIDADLLKQLGWSTELINEVTRVAEPMRQSSDRINTRLYMTTQLYSAGDSIFINQNLSGLSQSINIKS